MRVYLGLGSNVGEREAHLRGAVRMLQSEPGMRITNTSSVYETEPMGVADQPAFLNMVVEVETAFTPLELLDTVKDMERRLGRVPTSVWGPRVIDMDLLLSGDLVLETPRLTLPHPEFRNRAFVLAPLAEIAGDAVDPVTGKTVAELAQAPSLQGWVQKTDSLQFTP